MQLSLITNEVETARAAELAGIDRIIIDLERHGKSERQAGQGLFQSAHQEADVPRIRAKLLEARLTVRVDPIHADSPRQIDFVTAAGADYVMLPFFHTIEEVQTFLKLVAGRARPILLVETQQAAYCIARLCRLPGVAEFHIGLNDLSLSLGRPFLLDVIADGTVDRLCAVLRESGRPFGFGGVGSLSRRDLPVDPELVLAAQVTQGAKRAWLGRTFRDVHSSKLGDEVARLREAIGRWTHASPFEVQSFRARLQRQIASVARRRAA